MLEFFGTTDSFFMVPWKCNSEFPTPSHGKWFREVEENSSIFPLSTQKMLHKQQQYGKRGKLCYQGILNIAQMCPRTRTRLFFWVDFDKDIRIFEGFFSDDFLHNPEIWNLCGEAHFANHTAYNLNNLAINIILEFSVIFKGFFIIMRKAINIFCLRYLGPIWSEPLILFNRSVFFFPF